MGSCFSSKATEETKNPSIAKVISANGDLREYPIPVTVSQVIESEAIPCFLCNSDTLLYEDYIPSLKSGEELQAGQIYFVLPTSRLHYRLTPPEMAALAVKASTALSQSFRQQVGWNYNKMMRVSPLLELNENQSIGIGGFIKNSNGKPRIIRGLASAVKSQKNSLRKKNVFAIQSHRSRLNTICEESETDLVLGNSFYTGDSELLWSSESGESVSDNE